MACNMITLSRRSLLHHGSGVKTIDLPTLLFDLRTLHVKEPVDKVWGIVGLLQIDLQHQLAPWVTIVIRPFG